MKTINFTEFLTDCRKHKDLYEDYRLGQHFINLFIKDDTDLFCRAELWNTQCPEDALALIVEIITDNQWDWCALQVVREDLLIGD